MKFAYYRRLDPRRRRIYDRSDEARVIRVPGATDLEPLVGRVARGLATDDRSRTEAAVQELVDVILKRLHVQAVSVRVLAVRPSSHREELHGLYEFGGRRPRPVITVWMRTAQRRQVVAFRTFLRTLLHEVVHHLDYQLLRLEDSFHTEGFYKRAESLYRQLVPASLAGVAAPAGTPSPAVDAPTAIQMADAEGTPAVTPRQKPAVTPRQNPATGRQTPGPAAGHGAPTSGPPTRRAPSPRTTTSGSRSNLAVDPTTEPKRPGSRRRPGPELPEQPLLPFMS